MLKIGLTGNIGSGKSVVATIFKTLDVPVFDADYQGRAVLRDASIVEKLSSLFGPDILSNGEVDRKKLAGIVFGDQEALQNINAIIHPEVRRRYQAWCGLQQDKAYLLYEAAILIESGFAKQLDRIVVVTAPEAVRLDRVMQRDHASRSQVLSRMKNQMPEADKIRLGHFIIDNSGSKLLIPQVLQLHNSLAAMGQ